MTAKPARHRRIMGLETEYGCLLKGGGARALAQIRDWFFERHRHGMIDQHDRGWDEPPGNGGFLFNGGRIYIDMGHMEYCTPECATLGDVMRYDRAGEMAAALTYRTIFSLIPLMVTVLLVFQAFRGLDEVNR